MDFVLHHGGGQGVCDGGWGPGRFHNGADEVAGPFALAWSRKPAQFPRVAEKLWSAKKVPGEFPRKKRGGDNRRQEGNNRW